MYISDKNAMNILNDEQHVVCLPYLPRPEASREAARLYTDVANTV